MNQRAQTIIVLFMGVALLFAVASICYGTIASKPIDVAAVQFAGTITGVFGALLTRPTPAAQVPAPLPEQPKPDDAPKP